MERDSACGGKGHALGQEWERKSATARSRHLRGVWVWVEWVWVKWVWVDWVWVRAERELREGRGRLGLPFPPLAVAVPLALPFLLLLH